MPTSPNGQTTFQPTLAPPGQGPNWVARQFLRFWVKPLRIRPTTWSQNLGQLNGIHDRVRPFLNTLLSEPDALRRVSRRVLVSPRRGLEDSSRYWSVAMTCQHLSVVGHGMLRIIERLTNDQDPGIIVDTARVKPDPSAAPFEAIEDYLRFTADSVEWLKSSAGPARGQRKWSHPWFGPLADHEWLWLMGFHTKIHFRQMQDILSEDKP